MANEANTFFSPAERGFRTGPGRVLAALSVLLWMACSVPEPQTPEEHLQLANKAFEDELYELAIDRYEKLMEEYPFSDFTEEAQLKIADALYKAGRYPEAIAAFEDFQRMHPTNPNLPFTEYHIALSYMQQMGKPDRDQQASGNAHAHFRTVLERYPDSPYADKAREKLQECRESLAKHELIVADFYLTWENPAGAEARLEYLLENYPDTDVAAEGLYRFGQAFRDRGDTVRATLAFAALVEHYPDHPLAPQAKATLQDLRRRDVEPVDQPLAALMETLGDRTVRPEPAEPVDVPSPVDMPRSMPGYS